MIIDEIFSSHIFLFLNYYDVLKIIKVNKKFRSMIINDNKRWYSICFNEIYEIVLTLLCKNEKLDCIYCLFYNMTKYEGIIDSFIERKNELYNSYYILYLKTLEELFKMQKKITENKCECELKYEKLRICTSNECICKSLITNMLSIMFPEFENMSNYNCNSIIKYILLCCNIKKDICICEFCHIHFEENEILWIDECILYKCHLMVSDENCTCGLMSICKECRKKL